MGMKKMQRLLKEVWEVIRIKTHTPSYVKSGLMGCAVSAILIIIRLIQFYFFS